MIRKIKGGRYEVGVDQGRDVTGKRLRVFRRARTRQEAVSLEARMIAERDSGIAVSPGTITVSQFLDRWLHDHAEPNLKEKTTHRYREIVNLHINPTIGSIPLAKLRPMHVQAAYSKVQERGRSARTALHVHRLLRTALQHAVRWQLLSRNPADACAPPRVPASEIYLPNLDGIQRLLAAADDTRHGAMVRLTLETGMRLGEVCGLTWDNVDLAGGTLRVAQTVQWMPGKGCTIQTPKTARSRRVLSLSQSAVQTLRQHRVAQQGHRLRLGPVFEDHGLVFPSIVGTPLNPSNIYRDWKKITAEAGVRMRFHDLRHASATLALAEGVNVPVVSARLGHANANVTLSVYMAGADAEAAERISAALRRTG